MGKSSLAWPTTPLQHDTVWKLSSQNCGSCMNLCRANQDGGSVLFGKEIINSEAAPKIGNNSISSKQLNVANTDKTRSKRTRSQFPFRTLFTMTQRIVTMPN